MHAVPAIFGVTGHSKERNFILRAAGRGGAPHIAAARRRKRVDSLFLKGKNRDVSRRAL